MRKLKYALILLIWLFPVSCSLAAADSLQVKFNGLQQLKDDSVRFYRSYAFLKDVALFNQDDNQKKMACSLGEELLSFAESKKKPLWTALAHECLGSLYVWSYQPEKVKFHTDAARKTLLQYKAYEGLIHLYTSYANLRYQVGDEKGLTEWLREAQQIAKKSGNADLEMKVLSVLAAGLKQRQKATESAAVYDEIFKLTVKDTHDLAYTHSDASTTYMVMGDFPKAYYHNDMAYKMAKAKGYEEMIGSLIFNRACFAFEEGKYDESERLTLQSLPYIEKSGHLAFIESTYGLLMDINEAQKDWQKAFQYATQYKKLNDSLEDFQNKAEYQKLEKKYQSELKDKTIQKQKAQIAQDAERRVRWIYISLGASLVAFFGAVAFYQNRRRKETTLKQQSTESEMKALRAQMNPHFMFNSLNAIQQMVLANENTEAFEYLDTYSKLTRQILENSEKKWIPLKDEIRFLELYLKMESLRFDHPFQWKIEVDDGISPQSDTIPAMLIQPLVENSIKHGLLPKDGDKQLFIRFKRDKDDGPLEVEVEDNGVGRGHSSHKNKGTDHHSMSLTITENRLRLLGQAQNSGLEIEDLKDGEGNARGTKVRFQIAD